MYAANNCFSTTIHRVLLLQACMWQPKGHAFIKRHAGLTWCLLWLASFLLYTQQLWRHPLTRNTLNPLPPKKPKTSILSPSRVFSVSSCCAIPASSHANTLQLWSWCLPRQVAAGEITGLQVSQLKCSTPTWYSYIRSSTQHSAEMIWFTLVFCDEENVTWTFSVNVCTHVL